jgi:hypothetical protein
MKLLEMDARDPLKDPPPSCTVQSDRMLAALLRRHRDGTIDSRAVLSLEEDADLPPPLRALLVHARGCVYCRSALRTGMRQALSSPETEPLDSAASSAEGPAWARPEEAIAVLKDRGRRADWAEAVRFLAEAAPLGRTGTRRALAVLRSCREAVREGTALWSLLEETERAMAAANRSPWISWIRAPRGTTPFAQPAGPLETLNLRWPVVLAAVTLIVCLAGWYLNESRGRQMAALRAGKRAEAARRDRREVALSQELDEMKRRWTEAERANADLRAALSERAEAPVRVAVLQLFPAVTRKGESGPLPDALQVPKDAGIVTFSLASQQEILASDQAVLLRSADAALVAKAALLGQGSGYTVSLPAAKLPDGDYTLRLIRGIHGTVVETYRFRVRRVDR